MTKRDEEDSLAGINCYLLRDRPGLIVRVLRPGARMPPGRPVEDRNSPDGRRSLGRPDRGREHAETTIYRVHASRLFRRAGELRASGAADKVKGSSTELRQENSTEGDSLYFVDPDGHRLEIHASDRGIHGRYGVLRVKQLAEARVFHTARSRQLQLFAFADRLTS